MAQRRKGTKIQPAVKNLVFNLDNVTPFTDEINFPGGRFYYLDLSKICSLVNRRFYRQGLNWAVGSIEVFAGGSNTVVQVNKLPTTWVMSNAWEKVFRAWNKQQKENLEESGNESLMAKYRDFKIFANARHASAHAAGTGELMPVDSDANEIKVGEWEYSQLVIPNFGSPGVNYEPYLTAVGPAVPGTGGSYSLIDLYANSRSVPQSPDPVVPADALGFDNILRAMFDVGDNNQKILENASTKNDDLPYDQDEYPGGDTNFPGLETHALETITATTIGAKTTIPGGDFPCGLMEFYFNNIETLPVIKINMVPGSHRGYLAESMTEM